MTKKHIISFRSFPIFLSIFIPYLISYHSVKASSSLNQEFEHIKKVKLELYTCYYGDGPTYFDIEKYLFEVLSQIGLVIVDSADQTYDATMYVYYIEPKGNDNSVTIEYRVKLYDANTKKLIYKGNFEGSAKKESYKFVPEYSQYLPLDIALALNLGRLNYLSDILENNILVVEHSEVVESLAKVDDLRTVNALIRYLRDGDYDTRRLAVRALSKMKNKKSVEPLVQALSDENEYIQEMVAEALGIIGDKRAIKPLIKALDNRDIRSEAVEALAKIGDARAIEPILKDLEYKRWFYRIEAGEALARLGSEKGIEILIEYTKDMDKNTRNRAIEALGRIGGDVAVKHLLELLRDENTREEAEDELDDYIKNAEICNTELFIDAVKDDDPIIMIMAIKALAKAKDHRAVDLLKRCLKNENKAVRVSAIWSIERYEDCKAVPTLIQDLRDKDEDVRYHAAMVLKNFKCRESVEALAKALDDEYYLVYRYAAYSLGEIGSDMAITALIRFLETRKDNYAAQGLGKVKDKRALGRAVEPLIKALLNPGLAYDGSRSYSLMADATEALGKIGDPRAAEPLLKVLEEELGQKRFDLSKKIIIALGEIGDKRAVEPLIDILNKTDSEECRCIAVALGKLGENQAIEPLKKLLYDRDRSVYVRFSAMDAITEILEKSSK